MKMVQQYHKVTHVIFDMDGLLLDTEPRYEIAISEMCKRYGSEYTLAAKRKTMGRTSVGVAETVTKECNLSISPEQFLVEIEEMYEGIFAEFIELLPGVEKFVKHLKNHNIPIAIATSSKASTFMMKAKHHPEFFKMFSHIVRGSDDPEVKKGKPEPDIFLIAAKRFDSPPVNMKNVLVFEDSANGVKAGIAAGMQVVWVPAECTDTSAATATLIIPSIENFDPKLFGLPPYEDSK